MVSKPPKKHWKVRASSGYVPICGSDSNNYASTKKQITCKKCKKMLKSVGLL